jgi:hypothetical protein
MVSRARKGDTPQGVFDTEKERLDSEAKLS